MYIDRNEFLSSGFNMCFFQRCGFIVITIKRVELVLGIFRELQRALFVSGSTKLERDYAKSLCVW